MRTSPDGPSTGSEHAHQLPLPSPRPLGVTLIALYFILMTLVELVLLLAPPLRPTWYTLPGGPNTIYLPQVSIPLTLFHAWGLWQCQAWARTLIICVGMPLTILTFLGGMVGFKTLIFLAVVLYMFQPRVGEVFSRSTDPRP